MNANQFLASLNYPNAVLSRLRSIVWRSGRTVRQAPSVLRNYYERARYGVGHRDVWSFDTYLAAVVARGLEELAAGHAIYVLDEDEDFVYPEHDDSKAWDRLARRGEKLLQLNAKLLRQWAQHFDDDLTIEEEDSRYMLAQESMHFVARNFGKLWD
jgi:hypothetical protein